MKSVMGLAIKDTAQSFFSYLEEENRLKIIKHCYKNECEHLEEHGAILNDKLEETINSLNKNYKLLIVSNYQCGYIESFFKSHKLNKYFIGYECSGKTGMTKGRNIKLIIKRNNLVNPVYVRDTVGDLKAARFARYLLYMRSMVLEMLNTMIMLLIDLMRF